MIEQANTADADLLLSLQSGLPLVPAPLARMGADLGLTESDVLARVQAWFDSGVARRFGAVFDSRSLGYASTLCAVDVPAAELEAAAARIAPHPGITHCYERQGQPNLWFTLTALAGELDAELARVGEALGPYPILNLPALRLFKIEAVFGRHAPGAKAPREGAAAARHTAPPAPLAERERAVVRRLQGMIPVAADPFAVVASELGWPHAELLDLLNRWKHNGTLRRVGLVVRHHKLGFSANSMCVWPVAADRIEAAGRVAARNPHVTHCYERPSFPSFPYNLYAMVHAQSADEAAAVFARITADAALPPGRMLWSVREFKKASPIFFREAVNKSRNDTVSKPSELSRPADRGAGNRAPPSV